VRGAVFTEEGVAVVPRDGRRPGPPPSNEAFRRSSALPRQAPPRPFNPLDGCGSDREHQLSWTKDGEEVTLPAPDDSAVESILRRVLRGARKDFADAEAPWPQDEYEASQREALQAPLGLALPPSPRRRRVAVGMGFSLHADTAVHGNDRQGLERLCRYGSRGPVAESRLRRLDDGRYEYSPKGKDASASTASSPPTPPCGLR
jgi:hypothetical protein